jgi:hypothetical protein
MSHQFVVEPDVLGLGRIVVDGKYFALPVETVRYFQSMEERLFDARAHIRDLEADLREGHGG